MNHKILILYAKKQVKGILDFSFNESDPDKYRHDVKLTEQETKDVFYNKLTYIYLEMPKFLKTEKELETRFDKWMFVLKNLPKLDRIPVGLKEKIFLKLFKNAEIAKLQPDEYKQYEASVNAYRDIFNIKNTYWEKGKLEGMMEGKMEGKMEEKIEVVKKLIKSGIAIEIIINATGLSEKDINNLV